MRSGRGDLQSPPLLFRDCKEGDMQGKVLLPIGLDRLAEVCPRHPRCCLLHLLQAPGGEELKQLILYGPTPMVSSAGNVTESSFLLCQFFRTRLRRCPRLVAPGAAGADGRRRWRGQASADAGAVGGAPDRL